MRGMVGALELMMNMTIYNLPERFTEAPKQVSDVVRETLLHRSWKTFRREMIMNKDVEDSDEEIPKFRIRVS
jgi:hypothetical protein